MIGARGWVSVVELIVYVPCTFASLAICAKHGFRRSSGWIFTLVLCIIRIAGAICQLLTYNNTSTGLLEAYVIIDSIGLSPLLLATLGMLSRLVDNINASRNSNLLSASHFRLLQILITVALILSIVGGTSGNDDSSSSTSASSGSAIGVAGTSKAGICLFIAAYAVLFLILLLGLCRLRAVSPQERRVALAVLLAFPLIGARLLWSLLCDFVDSSTFNVIDGSLAVNVAMAVVEEFLVVLMYVALGFTIDRDAQGPIASRPWK